MNVKCNKCGHTAPEDNFPKGRDFFQNLYIADCPKCDNHQSPGDASMRMFGGLRPFQYVREAPPVGNVVATVIHNAEQAS
jgi:predicted nucleic-acid-binding Zn-ribbon protein